MKRERRKHQPPIPRDVQSLIDLFRDPRWSRLQKDYEGNNFFREVISRPGQMLCVVFISHKLSGLMTRDQWYCQVDATFQSTPNILGFKQIFTMHAVEDNVDECTEVSFFLPTHFADRHSYSWYLWIKISILWVYIIQYRWKV